MYRTHTCGKLTKENIGEKIILSGWVNKIRSFGKLIFIDLRDRYGITQIVFDTNNENLKDITNVRKESVIKVEGSVKARLEGQENKDMITGEIEIETTSYQLLSLSEPLPIDENATEDNRYKYRYLDLRRKENLNKLIFRHKFVQAVREYFNSKDFLDIETPYLVKSTPEGARDYVVPSRLNNGNFYALPQSPQLYKQILMIAGVDKYYQLARCFRDEDLRADRQPEHTQIDFEMSFVSADEIRAHVEGLMKHTFKKVLDTEIKTPFAKFTYKEAMETFGSDKPDLRFGLNLINFTKIANNTDFNVFKNAENVFGIAIEEEFSRKQIDKLTKLVQTYRAKGLAYVQIIDNKLDKGISKFLDEKTQKEIIEKSGITSGTIFFVADKWKIATTSLGHLRNKLATDFKLTNPKEFIFSWIVDFPLFSFNEDENKWEPEHHMFSMPNDEFIDNFEQCPEKVTGNLWDLALNGWEMASGSIRVSNPNLQKRILNFVGFPEEKAEEAFGFLLEAYKYGGPVHGGMGMGIERFVSIMLGLSDLREVIAFPKNKNAQNPMDNCPNPISSEQLEELGIKINKQGE